MLKNLNPSLEISREDQYNLEYALKRLYFYLVRVNSVRGKSLTQARSIAVHQLEFYLQSLVKDKPHSPATKYLVALAAKWRDELFRMIRTSHKYNQPAVKMSDVESAPIVKMADKDGTRALDDLRAQINNVERRHLQKMMPMDKKLENEPKVENEVKIEKPAKVTFVLKTDPGKLVKIPIKELPVKLTPEKLNQLKLVIQQKINSGQYERERDAA
ncbi:hypothetical protein LJC18_03950 [Lachnospiraceae bacterium OttesenSCG-928-E19]|nr:hypothetical protein [Lachnospiraceae bacterium OttesenSCG-928-E19]